jgi:hypothetical protein
VSAWVILLKTGTETPLVESLPRRSSRLLLAHLHYHHLPLLLLAAPQAVWLLHPPLFLRTASVDLQLDLHVLASLAGSAARSITTVVPVKAIVVQDVKLASASVACHCQAYRHHHLRLPARPRRDLLPHRLLRS